MKNKIKIVLQASWLCLQLCFSVLGVEQDIPNPNGVAIGSRLQVAATADCTTVVWQEGDPRGQGRIMTSYKIDCSDNWSAPVTISEIGKDGSLPQIVEADNCITVVWQEGYAQDLGRIMASFKLDCSDNWSTPVPISKAGEDGSRPQIAATGDCITVVWQEGDAEDFGRIMASFKIDCSDNWSTPVSISKAGEDGSRPQIAATVDCITVVWQEGVAQGLGRIMVSSKIDCSNNWSTPVSLSEDSKDGSRPQIAVTKDCVTVVWQEGDADFLGPIVSSFKIDCSDNWSEPVRISEENEDGSRPQIAATADCITVVWREGDAGDAGRIMTSFKIDCSDNWSTPATIPLTVARGSRVQVAATADCITVVWQEGDVGGIGPIMASYKTSCAGSWTTQEIAGAFGSRPQVLATDDCIMVVWQEEDAFGQGRIMASYKLDCSDTWSTPVQISEDGKDGSRPQIIEAEHCIAVVWQEGEAQLGGQIMASFKIDCSGDWSEPIPISAGNGMWPQIAANKDCITSVWQKSGSQGRIKTCSFDCS